MITPKQIGVQARNQSVVLGLDVSDPELGLAPGLNVGLSMSPTEARQVAEILLRKADEAEG
jgi:hypothetical protein